MKLVVRPPMSATAVKAPRPAPLGVKPPAARPAPPAPVADKRRSDDTDLYPGVDMSELPDTKSVTTRLRRSSLGALEYIKSKKDVDQSEAVKSAIKFYALALSGYTVELIIRDAAGDTKRLPVVQKGTPCS